MSESGAPIGPLPMSEIPAPATLAVLRLEKAFGGVHALRGVDFDVRAGEVHALLGENGAGKSTLVKIVAGVHQPDVGTILIDGAVVEDHSLSNARRLGIRVIYQQLNVIDHLTVAQNLALGREHVRSGFVDRKGERIRATISLNALGVSLHPDRQGSSLRIAEKQLIEIARALEGDARVLIMDEPTASLGDREVDRLFEVVRSLRDRGIAIVYISHKLDEVFRISDRVTVLRDGRTMGTVQTAETSSDELMSMMVGRGRGHEIRRRSSATSRVVLAAKAVSTETGLRAISLELHEGEILGVYGLLGSGRTELIRALFGADPLTSGSIEIGGRPVQLRSAADGRRLGLGLVPEERSQAAFPLLSVRANITVASADLVSRRGFVRPVTERRLAQRMVDALRIKTPSVEEPLARLSGGNQQKVIVARWLVRDTKILLLDDPTAGIDVGAKDELYRLIADLTAHGTAVLISSSELPELLALSDRMLVLHLGRVAGILQGDRLVQREVLELAVSGRPTHPTEQSDAPGARGRSPGASASAG